MIHVSIVVLPEGSLVNSIVRLFKIFTRANCYATESKMPLLFDVHLAGLTESVNLYGGMFSVKPDLSLGNAFETDLIIIPALAGDIAKSLVKNKKVIPWLQQQYHTGAEIASLCTAVFLLPHTNLFNESKCVTNWFVAGDFRHEFSQINLIAEKVFIDNQAIHTNGGAYSFFNLLLKKTAGKKAATECLTIFEKEFNRECQSLVTISDMEKKKKKETGMSLRQLHEFSHSGMITMEKFVSMFTLNKTQRKKSSGADEVDLLNQYIKGPDDSGYEKIISNANDANEPNYNNSKIFREILKSSIGL
jgi:putative intracellular protease/amidase